MIGSIIIQANPALAWETYHKELHHAYHGGPGFTGARQTIRAIGGFWQFSFKFWGRMADLVEMQSSGMGRHVDVYGERGLKCWEGLIVDMEFSTDQRTALASMDITAWGYFRTLYWRTYNQTALTGNDDLDDVLAAAVAASGQFIASTSIEPNVSQVSQEFDSDRNVGDILVSLASLGDMAYNRYVIGMYENRKLIYERAAKPRLPGA